MKQELSNYLKTLLQEVYDISVEDIKLDAPPKADMWDLSFWCFLLAKDLRKSPQIIAGELKDTIEKDLDNNSLIEKVEVEWAYLNMFLGKNIYALALEKMFQKGIYSGLNWDSSQTVYIDYIWANVWKPLHIGHMCTPTQWQVLINLFRKLGYNTISDSHIGDWGIIFWKLIVAYQKYGEESKLEENAVEHLFQLYVKISDDAENNTELEQEFRSAFKLLSGWDENMKKTWAQFTRKSIDAMNVLLNRLFVFPDYNIWESFYEWLWLAKMEDYPDLEYSMKQVVSELIEKWVATKNEDSSVWVVFPDEMKIPSCILQKRDGTHWYLASDLASVKYRMENWNPKKILYFVDVRQQLHLKQTFVISKMAWWLQDDTEITHAHNWFISLKDGAMSTRKWKIIKLEDLLDQGHARAAKIISEKRPDMSKDSLSLLAETISIWAIKYWYLKKTRESDSVFDWDEYMSFEWNSGPYIQYAYVRSQKILSWTQITHTDLKNMTFESDEEKRLLAHILNFPKVISQLSSSYHPHLLCSYVYEMTKLFSSFYANISVLSEENEDLKRSRLLLMYAFSTLIEESFEILWIPLPKEM